jgi:Tfp pilus assembly protein PilF
MEEMRRALQYLQRGDWEAAHGIVQEDPTPEGSWAHGIVHLLEGDTSNAAYWYRKAGRVLPDEVEIAAEIYALKERWERLSL